MHYVDRLILLGCEVAKQSQMFLWGSGWILSIGPNFYSQITALLLNVKSWSRETGFHFI